MTPSLLLPFNQDNSAIMTATHASFLLPFNQDNPAITTATHAQNLLLYAQIGSAITMATHAQNSLLLCVQDDPANSKLHLIVAFIPRALTAQTTVDLISVSEGAHQVTPDIICTFRFIVGFKQQHQSSTCKSQQRQLFVDDLLIDLSQCQMVDKNEMSNLRQCRLFVNKMIVVLFQISARAWPPKIMYRKEAQLVVELSFGHNKLIKLILASGHNEPTGLINGLVGHSALTKLNGLVVYHELIELINGHVGHIKLTELIRLVLDFQQGAASYFNNGCLHRLIIASVSEGA